MLTDATFWNITVKNKGIFIIPTYVHKIACYYQDTEYFQETSLFQFYIKGQKYQNHTLK